MEWLSMEFVGMVAVYICLREALDCLLTYFGVDPHPNTY